MAISPGHNAVSEHAYEAMESALSGTAGFSGMQGILEYAQLALVQGSAALPVSTATGAASPPQVNLQRHIKPNTDGTSANANAGVFLGATRYGTGAAGDGDAHDYYGLFSCVSTKATGDIGGAGGHGVIGGAFYGKALVGSNKARVWGLIALAQLDSGATAGKAITVELDAVNNAGSDAPDISTGQADGMTIALNLAAFGANKNSAAMLVQAGAAANQWRQGFVFYANAVASGGYIVQAPNLAGVNVFNLGGVLFNIGTGTPEAVITAPVGSLFLRTDAATTLYVKQTGAGNTGWVAK